MPFDRSSSGRSPRVLLAATLAMILAAGLPVLLAASKDGGAGAVTGLTLRDCKLTTGPEARVECFADALSRQIKAPTLSADHVIAAVRSRLRRSGIPPGDCHGIMHFVAERWTK